MTRTLWIAGWLTVAVALTLMTRHQAQMWQSDETLWRASLVAEPTSPRPYVMVGVLRRGADPEEAERLWNLALIVAHGTPAEAEVIDTVAANRSLLRVRQGRLNEALALVQDGPPQSHRWQIYQQLQACAFSPC